MADEFRDRRGDVEAAQSVVCQNFSFPRVGHGFCHSRFHESRKNGVHPDIRRPMSGCQIGDQSEQSRFRRGISGLSGGRMKRGITGNENDVTMSLPDHSRQSGCGAIRSALIIHRENLVPLIFPYAAQRSVPNDPGGTHQQIKRSRFKVASNGCWVGHIKCAAIRCPDYPAGLCETRCERFSQATSGSCDDQVFHVR